MKLKKIIQTSVLVASASIFTNSNASIVDNGTYTTDTVSGLDWLDVTSSVNLTYSYVETQFGSGGLFEGYRHATTEEVRDFHAALSLPEAPDGDNSESAILAVETAISLIGQTYFQEEDGVFERGTRALFTPASIRADGQAYILLNNGAGEVMAFVHSDISHENQDAEFEIGHYLVRNSISQVPLPAAFWLLASGLVGLLCLSKRKK